MRKLLKLKNERGYTLIESLFQLIVFTIFVQLIVLFFLWKAPIENQYSAKNTTAWELFALDLQAVLLDVWEFELHRDQTGFKMKTERGTINIEYHNKVIRKRVDLEGHVPFITHIQSAQFYRQGEKLIVEVLLEDGTRKERDFVVGLRSE